VDAATPPPQPAVTPHRALSRRVLWHSLGLVLAALVAWLILKGYRQPEFLLDFSNMRLC
jgi:hypothetical protein